MNDIKFGRKCYHLPKWVTSALLILSTHSCVRYVPIGSTLYLVFIDLLSRLQMAALGFAQNDPVML